MLALHTSRDSTVPSPSIRDLGIHLDPGVSLRIHARPSHGDASAAAAIPHPAAIRTIGDYSPLGGCLDLIPPGWTACRNISLPIPARRICWASYYVISSRC